MNIKTLSAFNEKFALTKDFKKQKSEVYGKVASKPIIVEFDLQMALAAYQISNNKYGLGNSLYPAYFPQHMGDLHIPNPKTYDDVVDGDIAEFFEKVQKHVTIQVLSQLVEAHNANDTRSYSTLSGKLKVRGSHKLFMSLLHFTLMTAPHNMVESSRPWYNELRQEHNMKIFRFEYDQPSEEAFAAQGPLSTFRFHGTKEYCVYSILRNGMQASLGSGVWMTLDINQCIPYSFANNLTFLCLEVRTTYPLSVQSPYFYQPHQIRIRALVWISGNTVRFLNSVATHLLQDLQQGI